MKDIDWRGAAVALGAGLAGAGLAALAGVPAGALIGSTVAVTAVALLRARPSVPDPLRDFGFAIIGVTLGSGVTPDVFSDIAKWPLSILLLIATISLIMVTVSLFLARFYRADAPSALLATSPGALSYTLALATDRGADVRFVMTLQSFRLLLITLFLPPVIGFAGEQGDHWMRHGMRYVTYAEGLALLGGGLALGYLLGRVRTPAPYILAGLFVSAAAHAAGLVSGRPPMPLTFLGFTIAGAVVGTRFGGIGRADLRRLAAAGVMSTSIAVAISAAAAGLVAHLLDLPFGQVWVSFAPGGVEGMSAMALALGYDPVYVATHHVVRLLFLIVMLPILLRMVAGPKP